MESLKSSNHLLKSVSSTIEVLNALKNSTTIQNEYRKVYQLLLNCLRNRGTIYLAGNGGSSAAIQHFATELIVKFESERISLPAFALTNDITSITAISNDYHYDYIFERQLTAFADSKRDIFFGFSTSGNSQNIVNAFKYCQKAGITSVGLSGATSGKMNEYSDVTINVPSTNVANIQESHLVICHALCRDIDSIYHGSQ